ncbi:uncharacterized protein [Diabrotica undecimpunctata]|uniref:uncharacterized protein n=1 Tax=Diabrotica undecimpunctata TaxID=50387 RepID=UPI003B6341FA
MYCHGKSNATTSKVLQLGVNDLQNKVASLGLTLSHPKFKVIKFSRRMNSFDPEMTINFKLPVVDNCKILGLIFDSRLTWKQHIQELKGVCLKRLNLIKILLHYHWGAEETTLLKVYRSLIRSKLDYECFVYMSGTKSISNLLNTVHNTAIRLCLGAFCSSPAESLYCEANKPPPGLRRKNLLFFYAPAISSNL